jgi:hypothetical protein
MTDTGTEIAEIENMMADTRGPYYQGPMAEANQSRYADLIAQRDAAPVPASKEAVSRQTEVQPDKAAMDYWQGAEGQKIIKEWEKAGGVQKNLDAALAFADTLNKALPQETLADLNEQYRRLPITVHSAVFAEFANPYTKVSTVSSKEVASFSECPSGAEMVAEWGNDAPRHIAAFRARYKRMSARLSDRDTAKLLDFLERVSDDEYKVIIRHFTGG